MSTELIASYFKNLMNLICQVYVKCVFVWGDHSDSCFLISLSNAYPGDCFLSFYAVLLKILAKEK